jgi:hypothetical protein
MAEVWKRAAATDFAVRRIIDARLALTLRHHGVTEFATTNVRISRGLASRASGARSRHREWPNAALSLRPLPFRPGVDADTLGASWPVSSTPLDRANRTFTMCCRCWRG